jgi:hypothetical protein
MMGDQGVGARVSALSGRYCWLLVLLLTPLLAGGVLVGDEGLLLKLAHGLDGSPLSFGAYARSPEGWYIPHHILWFLLIYASAHVAAWLHAGPMLTEAFISTETVAAALAGILLCYLFLVRRRALARARAAWTVLALFAGGYGVYVFCMGGLAECYMVLVMAGRLFFLDPHGGLGRGLKLAVLDVVLIALKAYSLLFIVITLPLFWASASRRARRDYLCTAGLLLLLLGGVKMWLWNPAPIYYGAFGHFAIADMAWRSLLQLVSPWTGLLFCLPVLLLLFWHEKAERRPVILKIIGLCCCAAIFSLYSFFDGDTPGGRYIFPFTVALLPELGSAASRFLHRHPRGAWALPVVVTLFLPVAGLGFPFPSRLPATAGTCTPLHPVLYSWRVALARASGVVRMDICFRGERYSMAVQDLATPHLGPWRLAYLLDGGHTPQYREDMHDAAQRQHDIWGARLTGRLRAAGLGSVWLWEAIGLLPAMLVVWISVIVAIRTGRANPGSADRRPQAVL